MKVIFTILSGSHKAYGMPLGDKALFPIGGVPLIGRLLGWIEPLPVTDLYLVSPKCVPVLPNIRSSFPSDDVSDYVHDYVDGRFSCHYVSHAFQLGNAYAVWLALSPREEALADDSPLLVFDIDWLLPTVVHNCTFFWGGPKDLGSSVIIGKTGGKSGVDRDTGMYYFPYVRQIYIAVNALLGSSSFESAEKFSLLRAYQNLEASGVLTDR